MKHFEADQLGCHSCAVIVYELTCVVAFQFYLRVGFRGTATDKVESILSIATSNSSGHSYHWLICLVEMRQELQE